MLIQMVVKALPNIAKAGWKVLVPATVGVVAAVAVGVKGAVDISGGRALREDAKARFDDAVAESDLVQENTDRAVREYGEFQIGVHKDTVGRLADWFERNKRLVRRLNFKKVDGVRLRIPNIPKYIANAESVTAGISGLASAVGAGISAQAGALWGVSAFASASTGTAISTLGGAAAESAILAWLGGGSIAAGGGGVAVGGAVLGVVSIVPALLIGGLTLGVIGAKQKTKSRGYVARLNAEIERIGLAGDLLVATQRRVDELHAVLASLSERATQALDELDAVEFDPDLHAREFTRAFQLVTAVKEVLNTPILDPESGELTAESTEILRKHA